MHNRTCLSTLAAVALMAAGSVAAAEGSPAVCEISAWTLGADEVDVREGPGADFPVIAKLPPPTDAAGDPFSPEVSVIESRDGWFRIDRAMVIDYIGDDPTEIAFEGDGWVSGSSLGVLLNHHSLYGGPSTDARVIASLSDQEAGAGADTFVVDRLHACQGYWVEVEGDFLGTRYRGWTVGTCSNQVTTCP